MHHEIVLKGAALRERGYIGEEGFHPLRAFSGASAAMRGGDRQSKRHHEQAVNRQVLHGTTNIKHLFS